MYLDILLLIFLPDYIQRKPPLTKYLLVNRTRNCLRYTAHNATSYVKSKVQNVRNVTGQVLVEG